MLTLYTFPASTCSQKVRFVLGEKGLAYEEIRLNGARKEQLNPDYLALNPNGVVPTLVHDGEAVVDSSVIAEYLDEVFPDPPMSFETPLGRARLRAWLRYIEEVPTAAIRYPSFQQVLIRRNRRHEMTDAERVADAERRPLRTQFYLWQGRDGFPQEMLDNAMAELRQTVERVDAALAGHGGPWVMGERLTIVDACLLPTVDRMDDLGLAHVWADRPRIAAWYERLRARPAYAAAFYPGARLSETARS